MIQQKKIILVGDGGVGKTTWLMRHLTGEFIRKYVATLGVEVHPVIYQEEELAPYTQYDQMVFNVWDCAGQEKFGGLREEYWNNADGAIIMFDVTNMQSYKNIEDWYNRVRAKCGNIPIIFVGTKIDVADRKVTAKYIKFPRKVDCAYCDISAKSCYCFDQPFAKLYYMLYDKSHKVVSEKLMAAL